MEEGSQVKVVIRFVVGKDGNLSAYAVEKSGGTAFDEEVVRVLKKMPKWTPGIQNGRPVSVYFNLPVTFMRPGD
jgi:protein TonB